MVKMNIEQNKEFEIGDNVEVFHNDTWKKATITQIYPEGMFYKEKVYHVKYNTGNQGQFLFNQIQH